MPFCSHAVILAIPISAITPLGLTVTVALGPQPSRLRLHPHLSPRASSAASSSSIAVSCTMIAIVVGAYETWGFTGLDDELIDILNIWARFIYRPLLEDRVRSIADGISPAHYGRRQAGCTAP